VCLSNSFLDKVAVQDGIGVMLRESNARIADVQAPLSLASFAFTGS
jgi:hypothetical protein